MPKHYVLAIKGPSPWVLAPEGGTRAEAVRAISWQEVGGVNRSEWAICTFDRVRGLFVAEDESTYAVTERGIYTEEAFARHHAMWAEEGM